MQPMLVIIEPLLRQCRVNNGSTLVQSCVNMSTAWGQQRVRVEPLPIQYCAHIQSNVSLYCLHIEQLLSQHLVSVCSLLVNLDVDVEFTVSTSRASPVSTLYRRCGNVASTLSQHWCNSVAIVCQRWANID